MKTFFNLINDKESNQAHSKQEIHYIVNSYTDGEIKDDAMTSWLKAICLNGMNFSETINYTDSIISSGKRIYFDDGSFYVGEVKDGKYDGRGTYTYPDGEKYEGEFKDGKQWTVTFTDLDGSKTEWKDGYEIDDELDG